MSQHIVICLALAAVPLAIACDKSGTDAQAEMNAAQSKANAQIAQANEQVTTTGAQAQSEADKKIIAAQADFAKTREDYRHTVQSNVDDLVKRLADLDVKAKTTANLRPTVAALRAQQNAFLADYQALASASPETWDATKTRLDKEWTALKAAVDKVD
jgi:hypothetical protein